MRISTLVLFSLFVAVTQAQTVLFNEDFESSPAFTLNTTDAASTVGVWNTWVINNSYTGGDGDVVCLGFPFTYSIVNTPAQPGGITTPNGNYLHTASVEGIADGITCCSFGAADGFCITADNTFSRMSTDVSTLGSADVELKFWWLCQGGSTFYGQVYYSTDGGTNWTNVGTQYNLQGSWTEQTVTLPAFGNQATLRFGFRFVNSVGLGALDPGFGIDDVRITASAAVPNSITTNAISPTAYCQEASLSVPFTAVGTFNAGNIFRAELSDASGSFAVPVQIGTLTSTVSGTIICTIPALTPVGTAYRVRVVASNPITVGLVNTADISVSAAPWAGADDQVTLCKNSGIYDLLQFLPWAWSCGTWTGPLGSFSGQLNTASDLGGIYTYTTNCPGGCPQDAATLTIALQDPANAGSDVATSLCSNSTPVPLISYVDGGDLTGIFFYNGAPTTGSQLSTPGTYDLEYVVFGTAPCGNDTAGFTFTVNAPPNAGTSTSATICQNDGPTALINLLGGSPQLNGTWTGPAGGLVTGILNPATDASGLYTYTVNGTPPCADAQAFVAVVIDPCSGVLEHADGLGGMQWLGQEGSEHVILVGGTVTYFELLDLSGRIAARFNGPFGAGRVRIDLAANGGGHYVLRSGNNPSNTLRLLHVR